MDPNTDREETIRFLPADRMVRNFRGEILEDYSAVELEYRAQLFPLAKVFDPDDWSMGFQEHWDYDRNKVKLWHAFRKEVVRKFDTYQLPVIELGKETPRQAVCQVFEKVNTGGVTLTVFELLTATFAADEFDLRKDWEECRAAWAGPEYRILPVGRTTGCGGRGGGARRRRPPPLPHGRAVGGSHHPDVRPLTAVVALGGKAWTRARSALGVGRAVPSSARAKSSRHRSGWAAVSAMA
ncbi:hypothetical protein [Actinomadura sp. B10D3]|uniref:hypothetical protein n=1 Tax=Actinomadura sp. B10D3 TaxID=3153557 RepID=UPI00325CBB32